jgi:hypothetical protein
MAEEVKVLLLLLFFIYKEKLLSWGGSITIGVVPVDSLS